MTPGPALELAQAAEVDAHHPAHLDEHHDDIVADAAADDDACPRPAGGRENRARRRSYLHLALVATAAA